MLKPLKVALIEIGSSHDECLYAQVAYLKSRPNCSIRIYCSPKIAERIAPWADDQEVEVLKQKLGWRDFYRLNRSIKKEGITTVIFNTGQGPHIRKLLLFPFPKAITFIASIHNINRLESSRSQKAISRKVNKYLVLNDYLLEPLAEKNYSHLEFSSYYATLYPSYPEVELSKPDNEIWIVIPGQVENQRRDYPALIEAVKQAKVPENLRFILLGVSEHTHGDGASLKVEITAAGLEKNFKMWSDYVNMETFYSYVKKADYIMPLIHADHDSGRTYRSQVSGTYNLAFGFKKCLLMEEAYHEIEDFKDSAVFYQKNDLANFLQQLANKPNKKLYQLPKWSFYYQADRYIKFISL